MPASEPCPTAEPLPPREELHDQQRSPPVRDRTRPQPVAPGLSRRAVVTGVGGVAAVGLLTACGAGSTATAPAPPAADRRRPAVPTAASSAGAAAGGTR